MPLDVLNLRFQLLGPRGGGGLRGFISLELLRERGDPRAERLDLGVRLRMGRGGQTRLYHFQLVGHHFESVGIETNINCYSYYTHAYIAGR